MDNWFGSGSAWVPPLTWCGLWFAGSLVLHPTSCIRPHPNALRSWYGGDLLRDWYGVETLSTLTTLTKRSTALRLRSRSLGAPSQVAPSVSILARTVDWGLLRSPHIVAYVAEGATQIRAEAHHSRFVFCILLRRNGATSEEDRCEEED